MKARKGTGIRQCRHSTGKDLKWLPTVRLVVGGLQTKTIAIEADIEDILAHGSREDKSQLIETMADGSQTNLGAEPPLLMAEDEYQKRHRGEPCHGR